MGFVFFGQTCAPVLSVLVRRPYRGIEPGLHTLASTRQSDKVFAKSSGSRREPLIKREPDAKSFRHRTRVEIFTARKPLRPGRIRVAPRDEIRET
jgi:hypothetical protein